MSRKTQRPIKFCPTCGSNLVLIKRSFRANCSNCDNPTGCDMQEMMHGHYVCSGEKTKKPCDYHIDLPCYYGVEKPLVVLVAARCSNRTCVVNNNKRDDTHVCLCYHIQKRLRDPDFAKANHAPTPCYWDFIPNAAKGGLLEACAVCALCSAVISFQPGLESESCFYPGCEGQMQQYALGQPRPPATDPPTIARRRNRSPSPATVKKEPQ